MSLSCWKKLSIDSSLLPSRWSIHFTSYQVLPDLGPASFSILTFPHFLLGSQHMPHCHFFFPFEAFIQVALLILTTLCSFPWWMSTGPMGVSLNITSGKPKNITLYSSKHHFLEEVDTHPHEHTLSSLPNESLVPAMPKGSCSTAWSEHSLHCIFRACLLFCSSLRGSNLVLFTIAYPALST